MCLPTIAHALLWYLPPTMGYIHDQLLALGAERSLVLAAHPWMPERFALPRVHFPPTASGQLHLSPAGRPLSSQYHELWRPILQAGEPALLHVHDGRLAPSLLPLAREFSLPLVTTFLGRDVSANLDDAAYLTDLRRLFAEGHRFVVMSHAMARQVERLGCPQAKTHVIHHGVSLTRFRFDPRRALQAGPVVIATAGRLIPKKGMDDLARAFVELCAAGLDVRLRLIGEGPMRSEIEAILAGAGVRDRAELLGYLEPDAVAAEMSRAHLFCLPSRTAPDGDSEGIPNTLKEAMATGLPVVSTTHAGIPELVEDGVSGYLVPEKDASAIAARLAQLVHQPELWEPMGRRGRDRIEREYALDTTAHQLEREVYAPLLGA